MNKRVVIFVAILLMMVSGYAVPDQKKKIELYRADSSEKVFSSVEDTTFVYGAVFGIDDGVGYCDTAIWIAGKGVYLRSNVIIDDPAYRLAADWVFYDTQTDEITALGSYVELWSRDDSLFAVGQHAYYNKPAQYFFMKERPTVYLNYPDSSAMIEVIADSLQYDKIEPVARAYGDVLINSSDLSSTAGRAVMYPKQNRLELYEQPVATRRESQLSGREMIITTSGGAPRRIEVIDSARAEFNEPADTAGEYIDRSILRGQNITMHFESGVLVGITCWGQAYSWYYPSSKGRLDYDENSISGDTITFTVVDEQLRQVRVVGGAIGTYLTGQQQSPDSMITARIDTVDYKAEDIRYSILDSVITLQRSAHVTSGTAVLDAEKILFNTKERIIEAFSAAVEPDTTRDSLELSAELEPNQIPVRLKDGEEEMLGDYLEYSIDTEKGRIVQSKSKYEQGMYFGEKGFRAQKDIFYVKNGRYTPCDINYLHFYSSNMKLIEGDKLIARPVVMYIGRLPVIAMPYYVFPLKKGRHSGFLPFTLGNLEGGGQRYIRNVGYYWAASEYWDYQGALDYYEENNRINTFQRVRYNKRYAFDGYVEGNYARETKFVSSSATESKSTRWTIKGAHSHEFSPGFKVSASGEYQSDETYYQDYSANLDDRLNRITRSEVNFTKRFGSSVSLSGKFSHDLNLDVQQRTDYLPSMRLSLPVIRPFGSGSLNEEGRLEQRWYNNLTVRYSPSMTNFSSRNTVDSVKNLVYDTTITIDTLTLEPDTVITLLSADTLDYRSRKKYTRIDHSIGVSFPMTVASYFKLTPNFNYTENWYKVYETDQSLAAGLEASTTYRTYVYSTGASLSSDLYGTVYPNVGGLLGLRQVVTPKLSYSYTPEINRHPSVRSYAGGSGGSTKRSSSLGVSLKHVYQAKVKSGEVEKNLELVSITHGFSYDFENPDRPYSSLSTSFNSNVVPKVNIYGSMSHSFYDPDTDELKFWSPYLQNFNFNANMSLSGRRFLFDDAEDIPRGADSVSQLSQPQSSAGWRFSMTYSYSEAGRKTSYYKTSFVRFNLSFNLTPSTSISYSQYYDIQRGKTINSQVSITRVLKCWTGNFYWVPVGSNRGYGFRLYVTAIPAIKIDNSQNPLSSDYFQSLR